MRTRLTLCVIALLTPLLLAPEPAEAQIDRIRRAAGNAVNSEIDRRIQNLIANAIRCSLGDAACADQAGDDEEVIYTDENGEVIVDDDGVPITDREEAAARAGVDLANEAGESEEPGTGVWANYDFVPGDRVLFAEDFTGADVGDFPPRLEFVHGNMEIVDWNGERWLRATSGSTFAVRLPETLPEQFTLEFPIHWGHGNMWARVLFDVEEGWLPRPRGAGAYQRPHIQIDERYTGIHDFQEDSPVSTTRIPGRITQGPITFRVMADGRHVRVYMDEQRVANIPQTDLGRSERIHVLLADASDEYPTFVGPIRVAAGGRDLYDRLTDAGRVATQGILFDVDSDIIRPESTPTLEEIGEMLRDHGELRIAIEGHTDSTGDDAHNLDLSDRRANAVRQYLIDTYGIDSSRLEAQGYGEANPADSNDTPEGRQNNRRVELVQLGG